MNVKIFFTGFLLLLIGLGANAQHWKTGIVVKSEINNIVTYEVRLTQIESELEASRLDEALVAKEGIVSSSTVFAENLVTVQVKPAIGPALLEGIIRQSGYDVAKKFDN